MFHTTIVNSYIMSKVHMTQPNKLVETMLHLKFKVVLVKTLIKKRCMFYSTSKTTIPRAFIPNPRWFHYSMQWIRTSTRRRLCVVCIKKESWYCLTCDDIMVCFSAYFVESHSISTCIICQVSLGWDQHHDWFVFKVQHLKLAMFSYNLHQFLGFFFRKSNWKSFEMQVAARVNISSHFQKIKKPFDHVVMLSNWGIPMCLRHFGPIFLELHQFCFFFFPKKFNQRCFQMYVATRGQIFKEFWKNQKKLWPSYQNEVF